MIEEIAGEKRFSILEGLFLVISLLESSGFW